jgi:hypothetical protein
LDTLLPFLLRQSAAKMFLTLRFSTLDTQTPKLRRRFGTQTALGAFAARDADLARRSQHAAELAGKLLAGFLKRLAAKMGGRW